ncbi:uncharacterized protein LOC134834837 [Culicoides brevitarsis]|uniref:uncharacterized protein LOC134834837 n=1 Tax=Culicoides brevitarsis TaxID=469753 RepID=UPI00307C699B
MMSKTYLALIAFAIGISASNALLCHSCNSEFDPRCGDPFDSFSIGQVNCSYLNPLEHMPGVEPVLCRKTTQKVYGKIRVVRGCGYITDPRDDKECVKRSGTHDVFAWYCACTTDLCNTASSLITFNKVISVIMLLILSILYPKLL